MTSSPCLQVGEDANNRPFSGGLSMLAAVTEGQFSIPTRTRTLLFDGLTYAGREVENIACLVPGTDQRLNKAFDQSLVLDMNNYNIIHLATHASFNPGPSGTRLFCLAMAATSPYRM
ncbi:CHAT domain-containing protein [Nodosilinea sp. E11]|nr:CHAT domain-containing protein [Nodosilinea sp. E11]WOD39773.1 CHAT domain-containing protein [Nodosilinea sp. E11]